MGITHRMNMIPQLCVTVKKKIKKKMLFLLLFQASTHGGTVPSTLPSTSLTWPWSASWWKTMTIPQETTFSDNALCLSPVSAQVCLGTVGFP